MSGLSEHPLVQPVPGDKPVGVDLSYEPGYTMLEERLRGDPAQYVGKELLREAKEADWNAITNDVGEMLERSRDLYLMVVFATARLASQGIPGFSESLQVIWHNLENHGDSLYPELDPAEPPEERYISWRNLLQTMADPVHSPEDPFQVMHRLKRTTLTQSKRVGSFSFEQIVAAEAGESGALGAGEIEAAFADSPKAFIVDELQAAREAVEAVTGIETVTRESMGMENAPALGPLKKMLQDIADCLRRYLPQDATEPGAEVAEEGAETAATAPGGGIQSVSIRTRDEARIALEKIIEYYRRYEPASPLPLMLQRAKRLVDRDFLSILEDLHPDAVDQVRLITSGKETDA